MQLKPYGHLPSQCMHFTLQSGNLSLCTLSLLASQLLHLVFNTNVVYSPSGTDQLNSPSSLNFPSLDHMLGLSSR